jgi:hypothetical protein
MEHAYLERGSKPKKRMKACSSAAAERSREVGV